MSKDAFFQILNVAEELALHVRDAFGPMGKHVIIVDDVAKVSVTRNGLHILKSLHCADPFAQMIVRAVETHVNLVRLRFHDFEMTNSDFVRPFVGHVAMVKIFHL